MTVDELIEALRAVSDAGNGGAEVRISSELGSNYDGYEPVRSVEVIESESSGKYIRID